VIDETNDSVVTIAGRTIIGEPFLHLTGYTTITIGWNSYYSRKVASG
jgi:hypothetical protein